MCEGIYFLDISSEKVKKEKRRKEPEKLATSLTKAYQPFTPQN